MKLATTVKLAGAYVIGAGLLLAACPVKAADFTVTTSRTYDGGWQSTYRDLSPAGNAAEASVASLPKGYAPLPNKCDLSGVGGFEVVSGHGRGSCVGAR